MQEQTKLNKLAWLAVGWSGVSAAAVGDIIRLKKTVKEAKLERGETLCQLGSGSKFFNLIWFARQLHSYTQTQAAIFLLVIIKWFFRYKHFYATWLCSKTTTTKIDILIWHASNIVLLISNLIQRIWKTEKINFDLHFHRKIQKYFPPNSSRSSFPGFPFIYSSHNKPGKAREEKY